jgi:hypothetical protein
MLIGYNNYVIYTPIYMINTRLYPLWLGKNLLGINPDHLLVGYIPGRNLSEGFSRHRTSDLQTLHVSEPHLK